MRDVVAAYKKYKQVKQDISESEEVLRESKDDDLTELAKEDLNNLNPQLDQLETEIKKLMLPKDPNDDKNIIMEIRGAAGGDEASLFAGDLLSMYMKYAERQGWTTEIIDENRSRRLQGSLRADPGAKRVLKAEVRKRGAPRAAGARDRKRRPGPHLDGDRGGHARVR